MLALRFEVQNRAFFFLRGHVRELWGGDCLCSGRFCDFLFVLGRITTDSLYCYCRYIGGFYARHYPTFPKYLDQLFCKVRPFFRQKARSRRQRLNGIVFFGESLDVHFGVELHIVFNVIEKLARSIGPNKHSSGTKSI